jgi:transcriptional regulator with XRE-family HTH domain
MEQTLGKRISAHRKRLGLTQDQLAEKLGVTAQAVSKWENDQSCPDISMLPRLSEIFGTSIDALLGKEPEPVVHTATVVDPDDNDDMDTDDDDGWHFEFDNSRRGGITFASFILLTGILWLACTIWKPEISLWDIALPSALLVFGLVGLFSRFSFLRLSAALLGLYYLLHNVSLLPPALTGKNLLLPIFLVLFGFSLLLDALRKPHKPKFSFTYNNRNHKTHNEFSTDRDRLTFSASFGETEQQINMNCLRSGEISTCFGEYTLDFSGVAALAPGCHLEVNNSFGTLTLLVPKRYRIVTENSVAFANIHTEGAPESPIANLTMDISCNFGETTLRYI